MSKIDYSIESLHADRKPQKPKVVSMYTKLINSLRQLLSKGGDPTAPTLSHTSAAEQLAGKGLRGTPEVILARASELPADLVEIAARNYSEVTGIDKQRIIDTYLFEFDKREYTVRVHGR